KAGERRPSKRRGAVGIVIATVVMIGTLWVYGARSDWSPNFEAKPLSADVVGSPAQLTRLGLDPAKVAAGARAFHDRGCLNCHLVDGQGGRRGPNVSHVGDRVGEGGLVIRISHGGRHMPAHAAALPAGGVGAVG